MLRVSSSESQVENIWHTRIRNDAICKAKEYSREARVDWLDSFDFIVQANETDSGKNANLTQAPENKLRLP